MCLLATTVLVLTPWAVWTHGQIGRALLTNSGGGAVMYSGLGEDPVNPWGVRLDDTWLAKDAPTHGFSSPWSAEANDFYMKRFKEYVKTYPLRYARIVLIDRMPLALVPPYPLTTARKTYGEFNFRKYRIEEGLTRWGVVMRHPGKVLRYMWREIFMAGISAALFISMLWVCAVHRREWRRIAWLVLPWLQIVCTICLVKFVDPRNLAPVLVLQSITLAITLLDIRAKFGRAKDPQGT